jgi:hypothetical protein
MGGARCGGWQRVIWSRFKGCPKEIREEDAGGVEACESPDPSAQISLIRQDVNEQSETNDRREAAYDATGDPVRRALGGRADACESSNDKMRYEKGEKHRNFGVPYPKDLLEGALSDNG